MKRDAFTLIELLVVIAIIAVLSVVVVLSLNPAELLRQSRDANRLSDLSTLNSALNLYTTDQAGIAGFSLGNASSVYVSLPDSSSTCGTWNLPALSAGYAYACVASTSTKNINTTGWIPVNFSNISGGAPFSILPMDGVNQSSSGLYYTYYSNGSQFIVTAIPESQKQKQSYAAKTIIQNYPDVLANGSNLSISPLFNVSGLAGYWNFDEGTGGTILDQSGGGNNGNWLGSASGTNGFYSPGKVGSWAGYFNGASTMIPINQGPSYNLNLSGFTGLTISGWVYTNNGTSQQTFLGMGNPYNASGYGFISTDNYPTANQMGFQVNDGGATCANTFGASSALPASTWTFVTINMTSTTATLYMNGSFAGAFSIASCGISSLGTSTFNIGRYGTVGVNFWNGLIDDVRVYSRALSPAEIAAIYNAEK